MGNKLTIKQMRLLNGLSQEEVSRTNGISISREHLSKIEIDFENLRRSKIQTILDLVNLYGYNVGDVIFFEK